MPNSDTVARRSSSRYSSAAQKFSSGLKSILPARSRKSATRPSRKAPSGGPESQDASVQPSSKPQIGKTPIQDAEDKATQMPLETQTEEFVAAGDQRTDADRQLCQHCVDLQLGRLKNCKDVDTSTHPAFQDLARSGDNVYDCELCRFFEETKADLLRRELPTRSANSQLPPAERKMQLAHGKSIISGETITLRLPGSTEQMQDKVAKDPVFADMGYHSLDLVRDPPEIPTHPEALRTIRHWLHECHETHETCNASMMPSYTPDRLLYVGTEEDPELHLWLKEDTKQRTYVALSHCWGTGQPFVLDSHNLDAYRTSIDESQAPQTFRDAFDMTRRLGFQFTWIDSLCIKQDDQKDWEYQSARMGRIYRNAVVTIAASCSAGDDQGFIRRRTPAFVKCGSRLIEGAEKDVFVSRIWPSDFWAENPTASLLNSEPLTSRGWTVQERTLSRRNIFFGSNQMFWQCQTAIKCEDGRSIKDWSSWQEHGFQRWDEIVKSFTYCNLTRPSDKLPALSGIASELALKTEDIYFAGYWLRDLPTQLAWSVCPDGPGFCFTPRPQRYRAPSWSWASLDLPVQMPLRGGDTTLARVIAHNIQVASEANPYGEVTGGYLVISAPFCSLHRVNDGNTGEHAVFQADGGRALSSNSHLHLIGVGLSFDVPSDEIPSLLYAAFTTVFTHSTVPRYSGLLLTSVDNEEDCYIRVGMFRIESPEVNIDGMKTPWITLK